MRPGGGLDGGRTLRAAVGAVGTFMLTSSYPARSAAPDGKVGNLAAGGLPARDE
ncbi:hypothetical protein [Kibdelosporangium persicum]|uniref:hypothetical protein n=1 Tax=Kibdelosporangium persicum TaxID=2698649 RepID=UPI001567A333|nr:hypothetical protein [Kibdelosporangium persicum]